MLDFIDQIQVYVLKFNFFCNVVMCYFDWLLSPCSAAFLPYLEESYKELVNLLEYPSSRVKKGAVTALGQFCVCVHEVNKSPAGGDNGSSLMGRFLY